MPIGTSIRPVLLTFPVRANAFVPWLQLAIEQAEEMGLLGENILNSGFSFRLHISQGAGAPVRAVQDNRRNVAEGFHIVQHGRLFEQTLLHPADLLL